MPDLEALFIMHLMLRFPPILAGTKSHLDHFHRPSKSRFFKFPLLSRVILFSRLSADSRQLLLQ